MRETRHPSHVRVRVLEEHRYALRVARDRVIQSPAHARVSKSSDPLDMPAIWVIAPQTLNDRANALEQRSRFSEMRLT